MFSINITSHFEEKAALFKKRDNCEKHLILPLTFVYVK